MASILKVDTIQDQDGNNIISENANVITIGASGDTITIPSGATFASVGIDDNATSTAITIDSSERVGIGTSSPISTLDVNGQLNINNTNWLTFSNKNILFSSGAVGGTLIQSVSGAENILFRTSTGSEKMRVNSNGNIGIGTSSPSRKLHVLSGSGTAQIQSTTTASTLYFGDTNSTTIDNQGIGSVGNNIFLMTNGIERMRIDSSGNVGIGTTSPRSILSTQDNYDVAYDGTSGSTAQMENGVTLMVENQHYTNLNRFAQLALRVSGGSGASYARLVAIEPSAAVADFAISLRNGSNYTETLKIKGASGRVGIGNSSPAAKFHVDTNETSVVARFENQSATPYGHFWNFENASPDNNSQYFLRCQDSTTNRLYIWSDGDVVNHDNSYGSISDERIKQDIRDSNSQWSDIKNIRVRNFKKKDDVRQYGENASEQIGVIAQELETVSPKLIKHSDPTPSDILSDSSFGTLYQEGDEIPEGKNIGDVKEVHEQVKKVSYSVLYMKAIKALQEAMERIETLEAKVQTLENNQP